MLTVVEDDSEVDAIATFTTKLPRLHRLFVENKIDAILMPEQLMRYIAARKLIMRPSLPTVVIVLVSVRAYAQQSRSRIAEGNKQ